MIKGLFICAIGIDGSGKTTLTKGLIMDLNKMGIPLEYRWAKFESMFIRLIISIKNKIFITDQDHTKNYEKSLKIKKRVFDNDLLRNFYMWFFFMSYNFQIFCKVTLPLGLGKNIICDRYIYDTAVDLAYDLRLQNHEVSNRLEQLFIMARKPDILIFIDIPEKVSFERKNDIPSIDFLKQKRKLYLNLLNSKNMDAKKFILLDGTSSAETLRRDAMSVISKYINQREV